ncbi:hypothetical protein ACQKMD_17910 [Viridibacillus sp. NPDC096237]
MLGVSEAIILRRLKDLEG